jgi:hypothetical protein
MIFRLASVDVECFRARFGPDDVSLMIRKLLCNCTRVIGRDGRELNPLRIEDLTEAEVEGRRQVREYAHFFRDRLEGCENSFFNDSGVQIGVRQTRQVVGREILINDDVVEGRNRPTR